MKERRTLYRMSVNIHRYVARLMLVIAAFCFTVENVFAQFPVSDLKSYGGRVVTEDGEPIADAEVFIAGSIYSRMRNINIPHAEVVAQTSSDGSFTVPLPHNGDIQSVDGIIALAPGLSVGGIRFSNETDPEDIIITLHKPAAVSGVVRLMDGKPLKGANVYVYYYNTGRAEAELVSLRADLPGHEVVTDSEGWYSIEYLPEGTTVAIEVVKTGCYGDSRPLETTSGTDGNDLYLEPGGSIAGRVIEADTGAPVTDISITARSQSARVETRTDENGYYLLEGLRPGEFRIFVNPDDRHFGLCAQPVEGVVVTLDQPVENMNIDMVRGVTITGTVVERGTDAPVTDCPVRVTKDYYVTDYVSGPEGRRLVRSGSEDIILGWSYTDDEGQFEVTALPGQVHVRPWPEEGYRFEVNDVSRQVDEDGSCEEIQFVLTPELPPIAGIIYLPDGSPAKGVFIAGNPGPASRQWVTNTAGQFSVGGNYEEGMATVYADDPERELEGYAEKWVPFDEPMEIHLHPYRFTFLSGTVVDSNGKPVAGKTIECLHTDGWNNRVEFAEMETDENGAFRFDNLRVGHYYRFMLGDERSKSLQIMVGEVNEPIILEQPLPERWLEGRVIDMAGNTVIGVQVRAYDESLGRAHSVPTWNNTGRFRIEGLASDTVNVSIHTPMYDYITFDSVPTNTEQEFVVSLRK